jgi:hypothetical protein
MSINLPIGAKALHILSLICLNDHGRLLFYKVYFKFPVYGNMPRSPYRAVYYSMGDTTKAVSFGNINMKSLDFRFS